MSELDNTFVDLGGNVRIDAPSNDVVDLSTYSGSSEVSLVGDCILSGAINSGTNFGSHTMMIGGERGNSWVPGVNIAMGNGFGGGNSPRVPAAGRAIAISVSTTTASTGEVAVTINGTATALRVSLAAATTGFAFGSESFTANSRIQVTPTSGSFEKPRVNIFIIFD